MSHNLLADYYARRAAEYEQVYAKPERQSDLHRLRERCSGFFTGKDVLEIACGTGYWTTQASYSANSVIGTDINEEVLEIARAKHYSSSNVRFLREDAFALPFRDGSFTGGLACFWWSHISKVRIQDFLAGFHRTLASRARVLIIDNVFAPASSTPISRTSPAGDTYQIRTLKDGSSYEVLKNFPTELELKEALAPWARQVQVEMGKYYWLLSYELERRE